MVTVNRWGRKSIKVQTRLQLEAMELKYKSGRRERYVHNFSRIARRYRVTRELVRQVAEAEGVLSYQNAEPRIKRALEKKGMKK